MTLSSSPKLIITAKTGNLLNGCASNLTKVNFSLILKERYFIFKVNEFFIYVCFKGRELDSCSFPILATKLFYLVGLRIDNWNLFLPSLVLTLL